MPLAEVSQVQSINVRTIKPRLGGELFLKARAGVELVRERFTHPFQHTEFTIDSDNGVIFIQRPVRELAQTTDSDRSVRVDELLTETLQRVHYPFSLEHMREIKGNKGWFHVDHHRDIEFSYVGDIWQKLTVRQSKLPESLQHDRDFVTFIVAALGIDQRVYGSYGDDELSPTQALFAHTPLVMYSEPWKSQRNPDVNDWDKMTEVADTMLAEGLINQKPAPKNRYASHYIYVTDKVDSLLS